MPTHDQLVTATTAAAALESNLEHWPFIERLRWLTEAELVCRMRLALADALPNPDPG